MSDKIRAMIIDDSAMMRNLVTRVLSKSPEIEVAGTALNGRFGLNKLNSLKPDIIVLDLEMPEMNGIEFLKERNKLGNKTPVIILSSHAKKGASITLEALSLGASDFILKPSEPGANLDEITRNLIEMVLALGKPASYLPIELDKNKVRRPIIADSKLKLPKIEVDQYIQSIAQIPDIKLVAIGISTGGPNALREILPLFPKTFPVPIVIVQHMPPGFTYEFAAHLNKTCQLEVKEAAENDLVKPGRILIAPGDKHIRFEKKSLATIIKLDNSDPVNGHKPSVDVLFDSAAKTYGINTLGCIMTGMGRDGADKIGNILRLGGITISQDQETSIVFGMPKVAIMNRNIQLIRPLKEIAQTIMTVVEKKSID
ncbi:MAG: chemotaxis response regulator protein-glutamate methylesterase [Spirochaetes bacterium]|nr:chemotaxis response regulator protein-glutamate methylesterase [Spirochaetota bacterium]